MCIRDRGYTYEEAEKILTDAKLKVEKIEETSQKVQEGVVIKQEPAENTSANAGDTIKVHVSTGTGIKQVAVPSLVNKTQEAASKELTDNNLKVSVAYEEDTTKENGIVLRQYNILVYGDVNGDGKISSIDLLVLQRHILQIEEIDGIYKKAANIRKDGKKPTSIDLLLIQRHILGLQNIEQ